MNFTAFFAGLQFASFGTAESEAGSLTYTSVVLFLPLGTLVAQRLSTSPSFSAQTRSVNTAKSATNASSKKGFLSNWSHHSQGVANNVSIHSGRPLKEKVDPVDLELQRIDDDDATGSNGVWIDRQVKLHRVDRS